MADKPTIDSNLPPAGEPAEPTKTEPVVATTPEPTPQPEPDPLRLSPNLQTRYKSAADLETFAATQQGEADRLRSEFETYKQQHPTEPAQPNAPTGEEQLERFAQDPVAFVQNATNDIRAQVALSEFARTHPDLEQYKAGMKDVVNRTPGILADPQGLEMAYLLAKSQTEATLAGQAAVVKANQTAQVVLEKQTAAVVEGATTPQPTPSTKVVLGMSGKESLDALKAQGIQDASDEDGIK